MRQVCVPYFSIMPKFRAQITKKAKSFKMNFSAVLGVCPTLLELGFLFLRQKCLFLSTSCTQNCPESKILKSENLMYLYLKCVFFLKVSQHLISRTQLFSKVSRRVLIFKTICYSNVIWDDLIIETPLNYLIGRCSFCIIP